MLLPPPAQEVRPPGNGRSSVQGGEEIYIIHWALGAASLRKLRPQNQSVKIHSQRKSKTTPTVEFAK